ncbi:ROK family transcriptional regulator [Lentibacillus sp.]|uniref:ROK family transcriptional regulator n=1 Tax=Lentibacillus sp. TaxID=1925746 RepID=UPI002B4ACDA8|nr:ROK family protein [Lentibacillus sp.]HLS07781.1 ROK family protein [Lentibacillus sp.]
MQRIQTGDQNFVKKMNKSIVFNAIKNKGPMSRSQISKNTGLNKATVSTMASELIDESLVYEIESNQSSGGRKPVMLYFNNHAGYSIGIDLGVNYILGVLTDLNGTIMEEISRPLASTAFAEVKNTLIFIIQSLMTKAPDSPYGVIGIGIGAPGNVDLNEAILFAPNLKWKQVDLKTDIQNHFHIPVKVQNEANCGAYCEHLYGAGKSSSNLIYISIGIGIGAGIIIQNNLYTGTSGISGEMGHFTINANGRKCRCGNHGCWELYASEQALLNDAKKQKVLSKNDAINLEKLVTEAQTGNKEVLQILHTLGEYIGIGLTNVINTFNPEMVIIGNRIAQFSNWLENPINHVLQDRLSYYHKENTDIKFSVLGIYSSALGAASIAISNFLSDQKLETMTF